MAERKLVVVRSPFFAGTRMVGVGEVWDESDAIVKNYPGAFRPLEIKSSGEAAPVRRAPRRSTSKSTRSTSSKSAPKRQAKKS